MSTEPKGASPQAGTSSGSGMRPSDGMRPSLTTVEEMKGYLTVGEWDTVTDEDYHRSLLHGRRTNTFVRTHLTLTAEDLELHLSDPKHPMRIEGWIDAPSLWGYAEITSGRFGMFVPTVNPALRRIEYCFHFDGGGEGPLTLIGFKELTEYLFTNSLQDQQQLYTRIFRGTIDWEDVDTAPVYAVGIVNLHTWDFLRYNLVGLRFHGPERLKWGWRWVKFFTAMNIRLQLLKSTGRSD
jgi:cholesterol oxidase